MTGSSVLQREDWVALETGFHNFVDISIFFLRSNILYDQFYILLLLYFLNVNHHKFDEPQNQFNNTHF